jgi:hypothetical protein
MTGNPVSGIIRLVEPVWVGRVLRRRNPVELTFCVDDGESRDEVGSLYEWLRRSDQLPGSPVNLVARPGAPGEMGGWSDLVIHLAPAEGLAVAAVVGAWLRYRGVDVEVDKSADGGFKVRIHRLRQPSAGQVGEQLIELLKKPPDKKGDGATSADDGSSQ